MIGKAASAGDELRLSFLLQDVSRLCAAHFDRLLRPVGLTHSQYAVVMMLATSEQRSAQNTLASDLQISETTLVGLLDRLEKKGLVERRSDPMDRRQKQVSLTERGLRAVSLVGRRRYLANGHPFAEISDIASAEQLLRQIKSALIARR
jgi:MarR family transcriptional regulator, transcriptional regulator for hemolysin